jgi:acetolactate synthase I/III small subunit
MLTLCPPIVAKGAAALAAGGNIDFDLFQRWVTTARRMPSQLEAGPDALRADQRREKDISHMSKTSTAFPLSPYSSATAKSNIETHTLSVLVDNEPGVLARVVGMFSGRGYNIESLTVAEVAHETHLSRITIVTSGTPEIIEQIRHQLERLVPVHSVKDLTLTVRAIERELAMIKVRGKGENRVEAMQLADAFRAKVIDATIESFIFELTGAPNKIDDFVELMRPIGLVEVSRTGVAAISRGPEAI